MPEYPETARRQTGQELRGFKEAKVHLTGDPSLRSGRELMRFASPAAGGWFRVMYVAKFEEAIYVLHGFQKASRKTGKDDIEIAEARYRAVVRESKSLK